MNVLFFKTVLDKMYAFFFSDHNDDLPNMSELIGEIRPRKKEVTAQGHPANV